MIVALYSATTLLFAILSFGCEEWPLFALNEMDPLAVPTSSESYSAPLSHISMSPSSDKVHAQSMLLSFPTSANATRLQTETTRYI